MSKNLLMKSPSPATLCVSTSPTRGEVNRGKCGYISIIGRPNVGKSTLLNHLIGEKISITSPKPQTTRQQIQGIKTVENTQAIYIDTPGWHSKTEQRSTNRYMNQLANAAMVDANLIIFVIDALRFYTDDEAILEKLKEVNVPVILAINKVDMLKDKSQLLPLMTRLQNIFSFAAMIPVSAKTADNLIALEKKITELLPENKFIFDEALKTDQEMTFQIAERIREQLIRATGQEIPYSTSVTIESFEEKNKIFHIHAVIWVERASQKPIIIGKNGDLLKKMSTLARKDLEKLLGKKVFLRVWVKVQAASKSK